MIAALYARVSTTDQNCAMQLTELREYAARSGWRVVEYIDQGISGAKRSRPALDRLMADARARKFDFVLVWKMDRFGRSLSHFLEAVQQLDSWGVGFIAHTQGIDTRKSSPAARLLMHIFAAFAEFERDIIVERVKAGVAHAKRQGKHCGRPRRVFRREQALEMRSRGMSFRAIARELCVPESTVRLALRSA